LKALSTLFDKGPEFVGSRGNISGDSPRVASVVSANEVSGMSAEVDEGSGRFCIWDGLVEVASAIFGSKSMHSILLREFFGLGLNQSLL
jgi:hypothetical protein